MGGRDREIPDRQTPNESDRVGWVGGSGMPRETAARQIQPSCDPSYSAHLLKLDPFLWISLLNLPRSILYFFSQSVL
jgi:hypothetical protein